MMEQFNAVPSNPRVMFDEEDDNGLVLCDKYLPVELLIKIFCRIDHWKTLMNCQLVCKRWKTLISYIWHKKTKQILPKPFPWSDNIPLSVFYFACIKRPYERNLVKNHSGAEGMDHWDRVLRLHGNDVWKVEEPPVGVPELPRTEPMFKDRQTCFTTQSANISYINFTRFCSTRMQYIVLINEGIHPYILDTYQPPIVVSEWYSCQWNYPAIYELEVRLMSVNYKLIDEFRFQDILERKKQNRWLQVSHIFENYGTGLRVISFKHGGMFFGRRYYDSKMAGAYVSVKIPENICICTCTCKCAQTSVTKTIEISDDTGVRLKKS